MNNVLPGFIDTRPVNEAIRATSRPARYGSAEEIAKTVAFLLSPDAATSPARTCASTAASRDPSSAP